jgi:CO/xanthine dehydrogenase Mo-binding subunit
MKQVGVEIPKVDALEKVLGETRYGADLPIKDPLHLKVVRSLKPHAKILKIQLEEALKVEGLERIFTAKDIPGKNLIGIITKDQPILATDRVRYVGDPIALVAARTEEAAEKAAKRVVVLYEDLPAVTNPEEALKPYARMRVFPVWMKKERLPSSAQPRMSIMIRERWHLFSVFL